MPKKLGRPFSDNPKSERLFVRVTPDEKEAIMKFLREQDVSLLDLIRIGIEAAKK